MAELHINSDKVLEFEGEFAEVLSIEIICETVVLDVGVACVKPQLIPEVVGLHCFSTWGVSDGDFGFWGEVSAVEAGGVPQASRCVVNCEIEGALSREACLSSSEVNYCCTPWSEVGDFAHREELYSYFQYSVHVPVASEFFRYNVR